MQIMHGWKALNVYFLTSLESHSNSKYWGSYGL